MTEPKGKCKMKTATRVFEDFTDDVIQSWERGGKADLPILISQALLALREVVVLEKRGCVCKDYKVVTDNGKSICQNCGKEKDAEHRGWNAYQTELLHRLNEEGK